MLHWPNNASKRITNLIWRTSPWFSPINLFGKASNRIYNEQIIPHVNIGELGG